MTREEIIELASKHFYGTPYPESEEIADFALAMVAKHNDELAKIAENHESNTRAWFAAEIARAIRAACPK